MMFAYDHSIGLDDELARALEADAIKLTLMDVDPGLTIAEVDLDQCPDCGSEFDACTCLGIETDEF